MCSRALRVVLCFVATSALAQVTIVTPGSPARGTATRDSDATYGVPRFVDLDVIALGDTYHRKHVITEGEVGQFLAGRYWTLRYGGAIVLIIPGKDFNAADFETAMGRRTEVRGVVRVWGGTSDPALPPVPWGLTIAPDVPNVSITVFAIRDRTSLESVRPWDAVGVGGRIREDPSAYAGKTIRIHGQFRGRNLFNDLPPMSMRSDADWVLKDGDTAVWVVGKPPKGDGWKLDPTHKGDAKNWLEVDGKPEVRDGVVYLKASKVFLVKARGSQKAGPSER